MGGFSCFFKFCTYDAFFAIRRKGSSRRGPHIHSNFLSEYPPLPGVFIYQDMYSKQPVHAQYNLIFNGNK